jgi:MFS-type transporter involved in bile tolerance (Atg22 family)
MSGTEVPPIAPPPLEAADHAGETQHPTTLAKTLPIPSGAWVLYDTANTVYAAVLTYLFAPYVGDLFDGRTIQGITNSVSMIVAGLCVPVFASLADHTGRARLYLIMSTMACVLGLACFGISSNAFLIMAAFFVANVGYNAALVFYNSLLASVASDRHQGLVSGLGVGLGYIGTMLIVVLLGLPDTIAVWADPSLREAMQTAGASSLEELKKAVADSALLDRIRDARSTGLTWTFVTSAGLFFVLALPCFLLVRERRVTSRKPFSGALVKQQFASVLPAAPACGRSSPPASCLRSR